MAGGRPVYLSHIVTYDRRTGRKPRAVRYASELGRSYSNLIWHPIPHALSANEVRAPASLAKNRAFSPLLQSRKHALL